MRFKLLWLALAASLLEGALTANSQCKGDTLQGLQWNATASGKLVLRGCSPSLDGTLLRRCCGTEAVDEIAPDGFICSPVAFGQWMAPDYSQCHSSSFSDGVDQLLQTAYFEPQNLDELATKAVALSNQIGLSNIVELLNAVDHLSNALQNGKQSNDVLTTAVQQLVSVVATGLSGTFDVSELDATALKQLQNFPSTLQKLLQHQSSEFHAVTKAILASTNEFNSSPNHKDGFCTLDLQWPSLNLERQLHTSAYVSRTRLTAVSPCASTPVADSSLGVTIYHDVRLLRSSTMAITEAAALTGLPDDSVSHVVFDLLMPPTVVAAVQDHCQSVHDIAAHEVKFSMHPHTRQLMMAVTTYSTADNASTHSFNVTATCQAYSPSTKHWNKHACTVIGLDANSITCECHGSGVIAGFVQLQDVPEFELTVARQVAVVFGALACLGLALLTALMLFVRCRDQFTLPQLAFTNIAIALLCAHFTFIFIIDTNMTTGSGCVVGSATLLSFILVSFAWIMALPFAYYALNQLPYEPTDYFSFRLAVFCWLVPIAAVVPWAATAPSVWHGPATPDEACWPQLHAFRGMSLAVLAATFFAFSVLETVYLAFHGHLSRLQAASVLTPAGCNAMTWAFASWFVVHDAPISASLFGAMALFTVMAAYTFACLKDQETYDILRDGPLSCLASTRKSTPYKMRLEDPRSGYMNGPHVSMTTERPNAWSVKRGHSPNKSIAELMPTYLTPMKADPVYLVHQQRRSRSSQQILVPQSRGLEALLQHSETDFSSDPVLTTADSPGPSVVEYGYSTPRVSSESPDENGLDLLDQDMDFTPCTESPGSSFKASPRSNPFDSSPDASPPMALRADAVAPAAVALEEVDLA
eukprot:m.88034 g.88034  ORF g.88034 m.88034 type:complete len:869 (-) comp14804_c0_seq1:109-2715(-)